MEYEIKKLKSMKTRSIVGIVLVFTLIGIIVYLIFSLIDGIIILSTEWSDKELDDSKLLWGLLTILLLGCIGSLVFAMKGINLYNHQQHQQNANK